MKSIFFFPRARKLDNLNISISQSLKEFLFDNVNVNNLIMSQMNVVMFVFQMELEWVPTVIMLFRNLIPYDDLGTNKKKKK